jgi:hypothetical protein
MEQFSFLKQLTASEPDKNGPPFMKSVGLLLGLEEPIMSQDPSIIS